MLSPLRGTLQHYDWGGTHFIATLLSLSESDTPNAEYWLGAHPQSASTLADGTRLDEYLRTHNAPPLSYLLKILDVRYPLSIQAHPSITQAEKGFSREEKNGVSLHAVERVFKDKNHKPEMLLALGDFYLLSGFREEKDMMRVLQTKKELSKFCVLLEQQGIEKLYTALMTMPQEEVDHTLRALLKNLALNADHLTPDTPDYWAYAAHKRAITQGTTHIDRGIFSIYLLNLLHLQKGESYYQSAGTLHAYLRGQCVEIMANSDNVLRGGLTTKHMDIPALLQHISFVSLTPKCCEIKKLPHDGRMFVVPIKDFALAEWSWKAGEQANFSCDSASIFLCLSGRLQIKNKTQEYILSAGEACFVWHDNVTISAVGEATFVRASEG